MTAHGVLRSLRLVLGLCVIVLGGLAVCLIIPYRELVREAGFRNRYGGAWRAEYEKNFGSLAEARTRVVLGALGFITILALLIWLVKLLLAKPYGSRGGGKTHRHAHGSTIERIARYHRNAVVGIYFGLGGIVAGVALVAFRWGIFAERAHEVILGLAVFLGGYCGVVGGCWCWLKAKAWTEAVVFIAFLPLAVFFIPYVRLFFLAAPGIILVAMVMMPLILVAVVFALPDKSGANRRHHSLNWREMNDER